MGHFRLILKNTLTEICRLTITKCSCFSNSRLYVTLTLLSASVLLKTKPLFDGINQQLEISLLKYIYQGVIFLTRFKFERVLLVRTCDV